MVVLLLAWLAAALILVGIDVRARLAGEPRGRESAVIWLTAAAIVVTSALWLTR